MGGTPSDHSWLIGYPINHRRYIGVKGYPIQLPTVQRGLNENSDKLFKCKEHHVLSMSEVLRILSRLAELEDFNSKEWQDLVIELLENIDVSEREFERRYKVPSEEESVAMNEFLLDDRVIELFVKGDLEALMDLSR